MERSNTDNYRAFTNPTSDINAEQTGRLNVKLAGTRGWLMFLGIMGIIAGGFYFLAAIVGGAILLGSYYAPAYAAAILIPAGIIAGGILILLGILMVQAASAASDYLQTGTEPRLATYFGKLGVYFKVQGIITIVALCLLGLVVIVGIIAAAAALTMGGLF